MARKKPGTRQPFDPYGTTLREIIRWKLIIYARRSNKGSVAIETEINTLLKEKNINVEKDGELHVNERMIRQFWSFPAKQSKIKASAKINPYDPTPKEIEILQEYLDKVMPEYADISNQVELARAYGDTKSRFMYDTIASEEFHQLHNEIVQEIQVKTFLAIQENSRCLILNFRKIPGSNHLFLYLISTNVIPNLLGKRVEEEPIITKPVDKEKTDNSEVKDEQWQYDINFGNQELDTIIKNFEEENIIYGKYVGLVTSELFTEDMEEYTAFTIFDVSNEDTKAWFSGTTKSLDQNYIEIKMAVNGDDKEEDFKVFPISLNMWIPINPLPSTGVFLSTQPEFYYKNTTEYFCNDPCAKHFFEVENTQALEFFDKQFTYVRL